jgi:PAS domain S-box-containing protein
MTSEQSLPQSFWIRLSEVATSGHPSQHFQELASQVTVALFVLDEHQQCVYLNPAAEALTGYGLAELQGRMLLDVILPIDSSGASDRGVIEQAFSQNCPQQGEAVFGHKAGQDFSVAYTTSPLRVGDRVVGMLLEVRGLTQAELAEPTAAQLGQAVWPSEETFRQLVDTMPQIVWIADAGGQPEYVSRRWVEYTGLTRDQTADQSQLAQVIHPADLGLTYKIWQNCLETGKLYQTEFRMKPASEAVFDGAYRWFLCRAVPIRNAQGQITRWYGTLTDIHERRQAEEALRHSEARFRGLGEALPLIVSLARPDGQIEYVNSYWTTFSGRTPADFTSADWLDAVHPEDQPMLLANWQRALSTGCPYEHEFRARSVDGSYRWLLARGVPVCDSDGLIVNWVSTAIDIHARKQAEAELARSRRQFEKIADTTPDLVYVFDLALGRNIYVNAGIQRILGYSQAEIAATGSDFIEVLIHPDDIPGVLAGNERFQDLDDRDVYDHELRMRHASGDYRWLRCRDAVFERANDGSVTKIIGTAQDVTDRKRADAEREELLAREQAAREQAEAANHIKDEFLAVVSHELRSPLNPILGWSKLLRNHQLDSQKTERALEVIERNAQMQAQLINDLLDVSRILSGKLSLEASPVNLVVTIQAALETVRLAAEAKSIQIHTWFDPQVGFVAGDAGRLQQVVWNLLSNAVKFTGEGGQVAIRLERVAMQAQITVSDTGKGIPPEFLPHVFDQFRQESSATNRRFGGLGLGLAIARYLVELHGGTIAAESPGEGQGATFTVNLPLMPHSPATSAASEPPTSTLDLQGFKILVVDDEVHTREFLVFLLEMYGASVLAAASATEAIAIFTWFQPNILLSDIGMPEMDGYMLMRQIRALASDWGSEISAIALTAYAGEINHKRAITAGFQRHLAKPIEPQLLIRSILELRR